LSNHGVAFGAENVVGHLKPDDKDALVQLAGPLTQGVRVVVLWCTRVFVSTRSNFNQRCPLRTLLRDLWTSGLKSGGW